MSFILRRFFRSEKEAFISEAYMAVQSILSGKMLWLSKETFMLKKTTTKKQSLYAFTKEINWEAALAIKGNFSDKNQKLIVLYKGH